MSDAEREAFTAFITHPLFWVVFMYFGLKMVFAPSQYDDALKPVGRRREPPSPAGDGDGE